MTDPIDHSSPATQVATGRDWQRSVRFFATVGVLLIPFFGLLFLVEDKWGPLSGADQGARDALHEFGLGEPVFVAVMRFLSDSGSALAWQIFTVVVAVYLLFRRLWRLAAFTVVTIAGSSLLNTAVKTLVHRDRPMVSQPFVNEPGASFPSGHSQAAVVGYGVLLLLILPALTHTWRRVVVAVAVVMVLGIGFSRVALAAHFVSDVIAGFALGAVFLGLMTAIFRPWRNLDEVRAVVKPGSADPERAGGHV
ncbi:MAG: phosphatase PAP2 family protein [Actinomycetota bacterium]|nr:phosphatase PAP2 family protein [Actinomycetota bacterium]